MPEGPVRGSADAAPEERVSPASYAFLGFLTLLNVMNFVDRQLLASFANFIVPDLQLTNTEFGLLTGLVFIIFYSVMGLFMGAAADLSRSPSRAPSSGWASRPARPPRCRCSPTAFRPAASASRRASTTRACPSESGSA
jgi:hypothetical protein